MGVYVGSRVGRKVTHSSRSHTPWEVSASKFSVVSWVTSDSARTAPAAKQSKTKAAAINLPLIA